jgi:hypothetical protein
VCPRRWIGVVVIAPFAILAPAHRPARGATPRVTAVVGADGGLETHRARVVART